jgi:hypothetical protein
MGMGGQVASAPACYGGSLASNPVIPQKTEMGNISKEVANTLNPANKISFIYD